MRYDIVFLYDKRTRYSLNALIASIDLISGIKIQLMEDFNEILDYATSIVNKNEKCIVALSLLTTTIAQDDYYLKLKEFIRNAKKIGCITICGGPHATGDPLGCLMYFGFDYVFIGEAEESIRDFIIALRDGGDISSVKGIAYLDQDQDVVFTGRRSPIDLNTYDPFPYWRNIVNPIEITRGCPYGCFYCQVSYIHGFRYRHRNPDKIVFYAEQILRRGIKDIRFISPDGLAYGLSDISREVKIDEIEQLLYTLSQVAAKYSGRIFLGSFPSEVRPEHVSEEAVRVLKKYVSNRSLIIGAQSGSERILNVINRRHSVEDVLVAVETATRHGFIPDVDLIIGFPGETVEEMWETVNLAKKITKLGGRIHLHYYLPLPGSPFCMKPPSIVPGEVKKELARIIGAGKGYGDWLKQEELSWKIIELHRNNVIKPRRWS
ncbi:MAG: TIGR04013 family B12-binding domain/radical SAM domain-containing protein [Desulfurococcaceae archaeon]